MKKGKQATIDAAKKWLNYEIMPPKTAPKHKRKLDVQKLLSKTGIEFHWPSYQHRGPGTHLENDSSEEIPEKIAWIVFQCSMTLTTADPRI